jgi:SAF domain-containing protein
VKPVLLISARDNVATALEPLASGRSLAIDGYAFVVRDAIAAGHKVALRTIAAGEPVVKYGSAIGVATTEISAGDHVHTHNLASTRGRGDLAVDGKAANTLRLAEPPDDAPAMDEAVTERRSR